MTEKEKAQAGMLYDANYDEELLRERERCADMTLATTSTSNFFKMSMQGRTASRSLKLPITTATLAIILSEKLLKHIPAANRRPVCRLYFSTHAPALQPIRQSIK